MTLTDDHPNLVYIGMTEEGFDRMAQHGLATKHLILLGEVTAVAAAGSGCDDENGDGQTRTPMMLHRRKFLATVAYKLCRL